MEEDLVIKFGDIDSWEKFYNNLNKIDFQNRMIFRGQANRFRHAGCSSHGWRLEPSLYRIQQFPFIVRRTINRTFWNSCFVNFYHKNRQNSGYFLEF